MSINFQEQQFLYLSWALRSLWHVPPLYNMSGAELEGRACKEHLHLGPLLCTAHTSPGNIPATVGMQCGSGEWRTRP